MNETIAVDQQNISIPLHDILFEHIQVCPIDDHLTMGVYNTPAVNTDNK